MSDATLRDSYASLDSQVATLPLAFPAPRGWLWLFLFSLALLGCWLVAAIVLFANGPGVWGIDIPVNWGLAIINYVWFLGIGHAGTLISALLLLANQSWRNPLSRFAEAMTLCAVVCAGLYPILHLGRPWYFYWMAPVPNSMDMWPQYKSPLEIDFWAVTIYLIVSAFYWYLGIVPDLAAARDRARSKGWQIFFGLAALGWRNSAIHWARFEQAYRFVAVLAVPLVVLVTASYASLFSMGPVPGWNSGIFPPYFLLGAVFSGFAVVGILAVAIRSALGLRHLVTDHHLDMIGRLLLATGLMTGYGYLADLFNGLYAGGEEGRVLHDRLFGLYAWSYWGAIVLNFVPLQLLWSRRFRTSATAIVLIGLSVATGMWLERFMLIVTALYHQGLVSSYGVYWPSFWEWLLFAGMGGVFLCPFLLFVRFLPVISAYETKQAAHQEAVNG